jgi:5-methylcytosine-specific restriction endonuclease McrA
MTHMRTLAKPKKGEAARMRRARKRLADAKLAANAAIVRERDGNTCRWCGEPHAVEIHHIVYRSRGGTHHTSNLICLCGECHREVHAGRLRISGNADIDHDLRMQIAF